MADRMVLLLALVEEVQLIIWLFALAVAFGLIALFVVVKLIRRDKK
jgi:hypothetical protein